MLRFFAILIVIWLIFQLVWMLFGKQIMRFVLRRLARRIEKNFHAQQNAHQQQYDPHFDREMQLNRDVKIKVPHADKKGKQTSVSQTWTEADAVQDVDFEDIRD